MAFIKLLMVIVVLVSTTFADVSTSVKYKQSGEDLSLTCFVSNPEVTWYFNTMDVEDIGINPRVAGSGKSYNSTLSKNNISYADAGVYECSGGDGASLEKFNVTVISIVGENDVVTDKTESVELACRLENDDVQVESLHWKKNESKLSNSTDNDKYTFTKSDRATTLNISKPSAADAGLYKCVVKVEGSDREFEQPFSVNMAPKVQKIEKLRSRVEDETAKIECNVTGYPVPNITWKRKLDEDDEEEFSKITYDKRINTTANSENVPNAILIVRKLTIKNDKGVYMCLADNELGTSNTTVVLKVKDKLAAVWPFLGICGEVTILCAIIFIFEKKRSKKLEEEEEVDAVKQDLMSQANGDDHELRQRNAPVKS